ncbi:MAG: Ig-like domain-containing protein [Clostridia bacterium]|nr:Ig-like domain-containing protein [Clostridia bacterium]
MKKKFLWLSSLLACLCLLLGIAACERGGVFDVTVKAGSGYTVQGIDADGYKEGDEVAFTVTVTDEEKQLKEVSADEKVLTAQADGSYKFTMPGKNVEISVVLESKTTTVSLSVPSVVLNVKTGDTASITATVTPDKDVELEWKTGNEDIATVSANGKTAVITAVAKGKTNISVSIKGVEGIAASSAVSVINVRPWTEAEENAMKEHLHGVVLKPAEPEEMEAKWDASHGQITVEGDWVEGNGLAEYAAQYTAEEGWVNVTHLYSVEAGTAYMFEKAVEVSGDTRYVRVFIYAIENESSGDTSQEGKFYITAYDPYVYEWPANYLANCLKDVLSTTVIPSVSAHHYYLNNYGVTAYYESSEKDGGYGAILTAANFTVEEEEGYYSAVSPDGLFRLLYIYKDGALEITIAYHTDGSWPSNAVANAFNYYGAMDVTAGVTAFVVPVFEGDGVSFMFADGIYNKYWVNEGRERDIYGTITVTDSTAALTEAYLEKLEDNDWVAVGTDGTYVKPIAESNQVHKINVTFDNGKTVITVYYFSIKDPRVGWDDDLIKENNKFYKYCTDILPAYTGAITAFSADADTVYLTVPEADFEGLLDTYKQILVDAGFELTGTSTWTQKYVSPNGQYALKPSERSSQANTIQIYFSEEMPSAWNDVRIAETLQRLGSSVESIPQFESETGFLCLYEIKKDYSTTPTKDYLKITISASESGETISQADFDAYKAKLVADADWTQDSANENKFTASDGTTITLTYSSSGSFTIDIKYVAA